MAIHRDAFYFLAGIPFMGLAKGKSFLNGYATPAEFSSADVGLCDEHSREYMRELIDKLTVYGGDVRGKRVLELCPGSSLAGGDWLLEHGATHYTGFDRFDNATLNGGGSGHRLKNSLNFSVHEDFRIDVHPQESFDVVLSNASFEHFDNVGETVRQLTRVMKPGGVACIGIDLATHSRWIRHKDPTNIYRYPDWLYRFFRFPGQPNRWRPKDYAEAFRLCGWQRIEITPRKTFIPKGAVLSRFRDEHLAWLSIVLCATRG